MKTLNFLRRYLFPPYKIEVWKNYKISEKNRQKCYGFNGNRYKVTATQEIFSMFYQYGGVVCGITLGILTSVLKNWNSILKPVVLILSSALVGTLFSSISLYIFERDARKSIIHSSEQI